MDKLEDHVVAVGVADPLMEKAVNDADLQIKLAEDEAIAHVQRFIDEKASVLKAVELCKSFKRIDMSFLQMNKSGLPCFAIMPYADYEAGGSVWWDRAGFHLGSANGSPLWGELFTGPLFQDKEPDRVTQPWEWDRWYERSVRGASRMIHRHRALRKIPETVKAFVDAQKAKFDKFWVAEEAEWHPEPKDPLVIGQKGEFFYLICAWDATVLESYCSLEFCTNDNV